MNIYIFRGISWCESGLTRISISESGCLREVTVPRIPSGRLIVKIHHISSVCFYSVWFKTGTSWLNWPAINPLATGIVNISRQLIIRDSRFGYTPRSCCFWCWGWCCWSCWILHENKGFIRQSLGKETYDEWMAGWLDG